VAPRRPVSHRVEALFDHHHRDRICPDR
jgi:hypothetical protein